MRKVRDEIGILIDFDPNMCVIGGGEFEMLQNAIKASKINGTIAQETVGQVCVYDVYCTCVCVCV